MGIWKRIRDFFIEDESSVPVRKVDPDAVSQIVRKVDFREPRASEAEIEREEKDAIARSIAAGNRIGAQVREDVESDYDGQQSPAEPLSPEPSEEVSTDIPDEGPGRFSIRVSRIHELDPIEETIRAFRPVPDLNGELTPEQQEKMRLLEQMVALVERGGEGYGGSHSPDGEDETAERQEREEQEEQVEAVEPTEGNKPYWDTGEPVPTEAPPSPQEVWEKDFEKMDFSIPDGDRASKEDMEEYLRRMNDIGESVVARFR